MLDDDDASDVSDVACEAFIESGSGWVLLVAIAILLAVVLIVRGNRVDCAAKVCGSGMGPKLVSHECKCVEHAE